MYSEEVIHKTRQMKEEYNNNMAVEFDALCLNVLDKSMMEWFNEYAPGFMCIGRKYRLFGTERHTIRCVL